MSPELKELLERVSVYLEKHEDVVDDEDGRATIPNEAMDLNRRVREALREER